VVDWNTKKFAEQIFGAPKIPLGFFSVLCAQMLKNCKAIFGMLEVQSTSNKPQDWRNFERQKPLELLVSLTIYATCL
jgi:hypothetical protein